MNKKTCCILREKQIYSQPFFRWESFLEKRAELIHSFGPKKTTKIYDRWINSLDLENHSCWFCNYIFFRLSKENLDWSTDFSRFERKIPRIREKNGVIIQANSEPNMVCCQIRKEKTEQFKSFMEPKTDQQESTSLEKFSEMREYVRTAFLTCGKQKTPICQACYDFLEDISVFLKYLEQYGY